MEDTLGSCLWVPQGPRLQGPGHCTAPTMGAACFSSPPIVRSIPTHVAGPKGTAPQPMAGWGLDEERGRGVGRAGNQGPHL